MNRLRWNLSKLWHKEYDSPYWDKLHPVQWRYYAEHIALDAKEKIEQLRDISEYAMAFHNYEAVKSVQEARELQASLEDEEITDIFSQQVEQLFGSKIDLENNTRPPSQKSPPVNPSFEEIDEDLIRVRKPTDPKDK